MELTNQQIILTAQAIARVGYPDESDLDAMVNVLEKLDQEINFSLPLGYHADNVVGEAQNDLEVQRCAIYAEREEQERKLDELEYELESDDNEDDN